MAFWTYMLHCRGGYFYVGHTDDIDKRIGEHKSGLFPGFAADHQPAELVWSQEFPTRIEALKSERRLKGWSRAKKLALIRGDWDRISALAKSKGSASTSSARTDLNQSIELKPVRPELVEGLSFSLIPHPNALSAAIASFGARIWQGDGLAWIVYEVFLAENLVLPPKVKGERSDGLWKTTCFELFVRGAGPGYQEFNFSPSTNWAAYRFDDYRTGMKPRAMRDPPAINLFRTPRTLVLIATLDDAILDSATALALCAVIEETDGTKSYWALAHPPGTPDFHHPTCFAATLPPPRAP